MADQCADDATVRILADIFHVMNRISTPKDWPMGSQFSRAFSDAIFIMNKEDYDTVCAALQGMGSTFEKRLASDSAWLFSRIRRHVPPRAELRTRLVTFWDIWKREAQQTQRLAARSLAMTQ